MEINSGSQMEFQVTLRLTEKEARALNAITVYGVKRFLEMFYEKLGKGYLQPHEKGAESLFETVKNELPKHLSRFDSTRKHFAELTPKPVI